MPRDADGNIAEWVKATDIGLTVQAPDAETTLSLEVTAIGDGWRVVYCVGVRVDNVMINLYINNGLVWKGTVRAQTPATAITRLTTILNKFSKRLDVSLIAGAIDCQELVGIAVAFPTDAGVNKLVYYLMYRIAVDGGYVGVCNLLKVGGHRVAISALDTFLTNVKVLYEVCYALRTIVCNADARDEMRAVGGTFMDKLWQASNGFAAAGLHDNPAHQLLRYL